MKPLKMAVVCNNYQHKRVKLWKGREEHQSAIGDRLTAYLLQEKVRPANYTFCCIMMNMMYFLMQAEPSRPFSTL